MNLLDIISKQIELNPNLLYLSGTPDNPADGVTRQVVQALLDTGVEFAHVDIAANSELGNAVAQLTGEKRFPQLFINGRYAGRPTVILTMQQDRKLGKFMRNAVDAARIAPGAPPR